jgi:hypothetical protein
MRANSERRPRETGTVWITPTSGRASIICTRRIRAWPVITLSASSTIM